MLIRTDNLVLCAGTLIGTPLFDRLAPARAAGFTGISVFASECEALAAQGITLGEQRRRINDAGLEVAEVEIVAKWLPDQKPRPGMPGWSSDLLTRLTPEAVLPIAEELGARSVIVAEAFGVPFHAEAMAEGFAAVCDHFQSAGIELALEFITGSSISTLGQAAEIVRLANRANGGILLDSWHLFRGGSSLETLRMLPGSAIKSIQISDAPAIVSDDIEHEMTHARLLPGDGAFDLAGLLDALQAIGCAARIGVEVFSDSLATLPASAVAQRCMIAAQNLIDPQESTGPTTFPVFSPVSKSPHPPPEPAR